MESSNLLRAIALSWAIAVGNNPQLSGNPTKQQLSKLFSQDSSINKGKAQNPEFIVVSSSDLKGSPFDPSHPMISLKKYFPQTLLEVQQDPQFSNYSFSNPNTLILLKTKSGRHALAYYQNGTLAMTSFVSIGTLRHKTISGQYTITPDQIRRRSRKYKNAPMPYSLHVSGGYFIHQGTSTGYPLSHGCIRVPWLYQQWLYKQIKQEGNTQIIIHNPYQATTFKKGE